MDPNLPITPFIYFIRRFHGVTTPLTLDGKPAMLRLYGVWRQNTGTTSLAGPAGAVDLRPGQVALSEPGMRATIHPGAQLIYGAFSLLPRTRFVAPGGTPITINDTEPAEPGWRELGGRPLPILVPEAVLSEARDLVDGLTMHYWRGPVERFTASLALATWVLSRFIDAAPAADSEALAQRCDDLIALCYPEPLTVAGIAERLRVSVAHLKRQYRASRCCAPGEALRRERLAQARKRLVETDASVAEVAHQVGYRDASSFVRAFRQHTGESPASWRRSQATGGVTASCALSAHLRIGADPARTPSGEDVWR